MDTKVDIKLNSNSASSFKSNTESGHRKEHHRSNRYFVPNIFKENPLKPFVVKETDPYITDHSAKEYCSLFASNEQDNLPNYLLPFKDYIDNVLDIPNEVFEDIAKVHIEREEKFKELEEEEEKQQAHLHALQLKEKNSMDNKVARMLGSHQYYIKRCCPVKIPFKSTLNHEEHAFYIRCFFKFQFRTPVNPLEEKEYEQYMSMQNRVFDEQSCLMNFSYKVSQMVLKTYNEVPEVINDYINEYVAHRCERALNYPSYYKGEIEIPLKPQMQEASSEKHFQFNHVGHLLSLGSVPWLYIPEPKIKTSLPKDDDTLLENRNPNCDNKFNKSTYLYKCPVSQDPNAEYLAKHYDASVVMTPSAFKAIVDNQEQPYDKEWNIPMKIKTYKVKDESGNEKDIRIIFIDKPLVRKSWLPLQKKQTYYKIAAKAVLSDSLHRRPKSYKLKKPFLKKHHHQQQKRWERLISYDDNIFDDVDDSRAEKFVTHSPSEVIPKNNRKRLLSEELERDLFISEDEEESRSSFDQDTHKTTKDNNLGSTASTVSSTTTDQTSSNITITTTAFNNSVIVNATTSDHAIGTNSLTSVSATDHTVNTTSTCMNVCIAIKTEDDNSTHSSKAAIPPPSNYKSIKKQTSGKVFDKMDTSTKQQHQPPFKKPKKDNHSTDPNEGFLDNLLDKQDSFLKLKASPSGKGKEAIDSVLNTFGVQKPSNFRDSSKPWDNTIHKEWDENIKIKDCPSESCETNVHYQLFSFQNTIQNPCKEDSQKPIRILVRHSIHGLIKNKKKKKVTYETLVSESRPFVLFPKIENQIYFGAEVNSVSEIVQQWSDLLLRPNTNLLQVRVCTESGNVLMTQEKNLESVLKDGKQKHINFNPQSVFTTFNVFLNTLMKMSSGEYLLHHSPKTEAFMKLMKSYDPKEYVFSSSIDLHKMYEEKSVVSKQYRASPWLAIDTYVFTPFHLTHHKIPATFPMENVLKLNKKEKQKRKSKASKKLSMEGYQ